MSTIETPRILLVDDDDGARRNLTLILEREGYEVEAVETGEEALRKAEERFFNVALLDVMLPDRRGDDLLKPLGELRPDMALVVVTGYASTETAVRALQEGATAYVTKPLDVDEVLDQVRKVLERQRLLAEKRAAQRQLRRSEERYRTLFEDLPLGLYRTTADGRILHANPALVDMLGYPDRQALMHVNVHSLYVDPRDRERQRALLEEGVVRGFEMQLRRHDGSVIWVRDTVQVDRDVRGRPVTYQGSLEDITDRKRAEAAMRRSQEEAVRSHRLVLALSKAVQAVQRAHTPEEVYATVAKEVRKLGYHVIVFRLTDDRSHLSVRHTTFRSTLLENAERLAGLTVEDYRLSLEQAPVLGRVLEEGETVFSEPVSELMDGGLPERVRPLAGRIASLLGLKQAITARLMLGGQAHGLLMVSGAGLTRTDVPAITAFANQIAISLENARAQQALREREQLLSNVFESMQEGVLVLDSDFRYTYWNSGMERISGLPREEVLGCVPWERFSFLAGAVEEGMKGAMGGQVSRGIELAYDLSEGHEGWTKESYFPLRDRDENTVGVVGLIEDITERKRAEDALEHQLGRLSLLNEIARAMTARHDLHSILSVVAQRLEEAFTDLASVWLREGDSDVFTLASTGDWGAQAVEATGLLQQLKLPPDVAQPLMGGESHYLADLSQLDAPVFKPLVEQLDVRSAVISPLTVGSALLGVIVSARRQPDAFSVAERDFMVQLAIHVGLAVRQVQLYQDLQEAYEDVRQTQRAMMRQGRLRALGQMASGIAHDINNAISPVPLYTAIIQREADLSEQTRAHLATIDMAIRDVEETVTRMRQFYRRSEREEDLQPVDLNRAAAEAIELTSPRWRDVPQRGGITIDLHTDFQEDLPPVMGNEGEIRQAVTNLILNAVDAMPEGGTMTVRTREGGELPAVVLEVRDTGVGMDEETQRRCLEPFFSTKGERGSGMGLATVYGTMQRHEGDVQVESALGEGTTMRLLFPVRQVAEGDTAEEPLQPAGPLSILCVDDEAALREALKEALEDEGHAVELADDGRSGLERFRAAREQGEPFDVVITDLGMPEVSGRQVARTVKTEAPGTPVILLTGWGRQLSAENDVPAAVDLMLGKPPTIEMLNRALARVTSAHESSS